MTKFNAKGLSCSIVPLEIKHILETENPPFLKVILDNEASQMNVQKFLQSNGFQTILEQVGNDFNVIGNRDTKSLSQNNLSDHQPEDNIQKIMVICTTDRLGHGDSELGKKLMANFIRTLKEMGEELWLLVFINEGVKLTIGGSVLLDDLKYHESAGVQILVCGTCLDHYICLDKKRVGETTNMLDIVTSMQVADKVITL